MRNSVTVFTFLLIGEVALVLPMSLAERWINIFISLKNQQFYQTLIGIGISPYRYIFSQVMIDLLFPFIRIIFILIGASVYVPFSLNPISFLYFFSLEVVAMAIFLLMAMIATFCYLKFYTFQTVSSIIGGAYFPTSVFPDAIKSLSSCLPQTQVLTIARQIFNSVSVGYMGPLIIGGWVLFLMGIVVLLNTYLMGNLKKNARYF